MKKRLMALLMAVVLTAAPIGVFAADDGEEFMNQYAKCLPFREGDGYTFAAVFLGYGSDGEANADVYEKKLFSSLPERFRGGMQHIDYDGDEWYLIVPRYNDSARIWSIDENGDYVPGLEVETDYASPFTIKCNLSDIYPNVNIQSKLMSGRSFMPQVDGTGNLVPDTDVMDINIVQGAETKTGDLIAEVDGDTFCYTADGTVKSYSGGGYPYIWAEIDGTKIKAIGDGAFKNAYIYNSYIDNGIESVGNYAYQGCTAEYIGVPATVTSIGEKAFADCHFLTELFLEPKEPCLGKYALVGNGHLTIHLRCNADIDAWKKAITEAKGDSDFDIELIHNFEDSSVEKDLTGNSVSYCTDCGFKASNDFYGYDLPFSDVSSDAWYFAYVKVASDSGIIAGKQNGLFDPDANMTVAEAVKIAACVNKYQKSGTTDGFTKMGENWYDTYVNYCVANNIIEDGVKFDYRAPATRAEMAYLFSRADQNGYYINPDVPLTDIPDVDGSTMYNQEILDMYRRGLAVGNDNMAYLPESNVRRSEASAFVARILREDLRIELPKG